MEPVTIPAPQGRLPERSSIPFHDGYQTSIPGKSYSAAAVLAFAVFVWWSVNHVYGQPPPPAVAAISTSSGVARPALPALPAIPPKQSVLVRNPFDATEVFEFPSGTTAAEGRQRVAELLLQRARERRSQWPDVKPAQNLRAANLYRMP